jgi:hypothetical protein
MILITPCPSYQDRTILPMLSLGWSFTFLKIITSLSWPTPLITAPTNWCVLHVPLTASADARTISQWVIAPVNGSVWTVKSVQTGQSIGFQGAPQEGVGLVVGDSSVAKPWTTKLPTTGTVVSSPLTFKYDRHRDVLSCDHSQVDFI